MSDAWMSRPDGAMNRPVWKAPGTVAAGARVGVRDGEVAVFVTSGRVVGSLPAGGHQLDPAAHPFLHQGESFEVLFVAVASCAGIAVGGPAGMVLDPATGERARLLFKGTYAVDLGDPMRVASELVGSAGDPGEGVVKWINGLISRAAMTGVGEAIAVNRISLARLGEPAIAQWIAEGIAKAAVSQSNGLIEGLRFDELSITKVG